LSASGDGLSDPGDRVGLNIEIGMRGRFHDQRFLLAARIDAHYNGLGNIARRLLVQADAEDAAFPEWCGFATPDPPPGSRRRGGHQWLLTLIDNRYKHDDR
jgi:hypothetical protein